MDKFWALCFSILTITGCSNKHNSGASQVDNVMKNNEDTFVALDTADLIRFHIPTSDNESYLMLESKDSSKLDIEFFGNEMIYKKDTLNFTEELGLNFLNTFTFEPSYSIFICRVKNISDKHICFYINGKEYRIEKSNNRRFNLLLFEDYILDAYTILMNDTLYLKPAKNSDIFKVDSIEDRIFEVEKVKGNWVKLVESRDCYIGSRPPSEPITGWVMWRREGSSELLLDFGLLC